MIGGATRGRGGPRLGAHLADTKGQNDVTREGESRGLVSVGIRARVRELGDLASHARSQAPLYHVHADPSGSWLAGQWAAYWQGFEHEFHLEAQPFAEAIHVKGGREHRHRVYSLVRLDGTVIPMRWDHARREKLHRLVELETGKPLTPGRHNRAVITALEAEGRHQEAAALRRAGLDRVSRPQASTTPRQRAQAERTGIANQDVAAAALTAWRTSDDGRSFQAALAGQGLRLAQGDRAAVLVDFSGNAHPLARLLGRVSKARGGDRITAAQVSARLAGLNLPAHGQSVTFGEDNHAHNNDEDTRSDPVVGRRHSRNSGRSAGGQRDRGAPAHPRPQGLVSGGVRSVEGSHDHGRPDAPIRAPGTSLGGRSIEGRLDARPSGADCGEPGPHRGEIGRHRVQAHRAVRAIAAAAGGDRTARLQALSCRLAPPAPAPHAIHRWVRLCPFPEPVDRREARRRAWIAAALRGAYGTGWLPSSIAARIVRVEPREHDRAVVITLRGGACIVDRAERIDIVGRTDDVAIHELVAAIVRRGWDAVEVHGSEEFRQAMALRLALLKPPVPVAGFAFSEADQAVIEAMRRSRPNTSVDLLRESGLAGLPLS